MRDSEGSSEIGLAIQLNGAELGLHDVVRHLRAVDRAWAFSVSVEAYQRGHQETWASQTQYAPRPTGLRIAKESPTIVELWQAIDVPTIVAGAFAAFAYVVGNVEKIATIPDRIAIARTTSQIERRRLSQELLELESSGEPLWVHEDPGRPPVVAPGEEQESWSIVEVDRQLEISKMRREIDRLERLDQVERQLESDLGALEARARSVQRELERAEPEVLESYGVAEWRVRRRRRI